MITNVQPRHDLLTLSQEPGAMPTRAPEPFLVATMPDIMDISSLRSMVWTCFTAPSKMT